MTYKAIVKPKSKRIKKEEWRLKNFKDIDSVWVWMRKNNINVLSVEETNDEEIK